MAEIVEFKKNELGYAHVLCSECHGNLFHVAVTDSNKFEASICIECDAYIPVNMTPC